MISLLWVHRDEQGRSGQAALYQAKQYEKA